jgi:protein FrlC
MKITKDRWIVNTYPYWHYTLDYGMDSIAAAGFGGIELWGVSPHYCLADYSEQERVARRPEILEMMADRGLRMPVYYPEQSSCYPLNIASPNPVIRDKSLHILEESVADAEQFGAKIMITAPGHHFHDDEDPENYTRTVEGLRQLCACAKEHGIILAAEEWPAFMCTYATDLEALRKLKDDVGCGNFGICLNTGEMHEKGESVQEYLDAFGPDLIHVHIADTGSRPVGSGQDSAADLKTLEDSGYSGLLSLTIQFRDVCVAPDKPVLASAQWLAKNGYFNS